jgi:hypothetical protein
MGSISVHGPSSLLYGYPVYRMRLLPPTADMQVNAGAFEARSRRIAYWQKMRGI